MGPRKMVREETTFAFGCFRPAFVGISPIYSSAVSSAAGNRFCVGCGALLCCPRVIEAHSCQHQHCRSQSLELATWVALLRLRCTKPDTRSAKSFTARVGLQGGARRQ